MALLPSSPDEVEQNHSSAKAIYDKTSGAMALVEHIDQALTKLVSLGDQVQPEDVIRAAGQVVGKGGDPQAIAAMLGTMPPNGGEALAGWVEQQEETIRGQITQLEAAHKQARHQMGVGALHSLVADAMGGGTGGPDTNGPAPQAPDAAAGPSGPPNPLMGGA